MKAAAWFLGVFVCGSNFIVLFHRSSHLKFRDPINLVLLSLASSDSFMGVYFLGLTITDTFFMGHYFMHRKPWVSGLACDILGLAGLYSLETSFTTSPLLFWVYTKIVNLHKGQMASTYNKVLAICILNHFITCAICLIFHIFSNTVEDDYCLIFALSTIDEMPQPHNLLFFILFNNLMIIISIFMCVKLVLVVKSTAEMVAGQGHSSSKSRHWKMLRLLIFLISPGLLGWLSLQILLLLHMYAGHTTMNPPGFLAVLLMPLNSATNPFLHTFRNFIPKEKK